MADQLFKFVSQHIGVALVGLIVGVLVTQVSHAWLKTAEGWKRKVATIGFAVASVMMIAGVLAAMVFTAAEFRATRGSDLAVADVMGARCQALSQIDDLAQARRRGVAT
ncbi:hypothetical protein QRD43_20615 [Pelomonas sp. APW6]|uniref:Uncharacterized protein n=1 Tax=Roseateles subflavus TaxID=3053353 RepID=A0ABT7LQ17_9BURK|nr:hypothetical protein [Pelomonas sp. APW6]MDL5034317.1 hypothetical protein [Pelomonas sp. APW6]